MVGKEGPLNSAGGLARTLDHQFLPANLLAGEVKGMAGGVALQAQQQQQQQHLQKVFEVQRVLLLQEMFKSKEATAENFPSGGRYQMPPGGLSSSGSQGHMMHETSRVRERSQTYDYGNHSNKALELKAVQELEKDGYFGGSGGKDNRWP